MLATVVGAAAGVVWVGTGEVVQFYVAPLVLFPISWAFLSDLAAWEWRGCFKSETGPRFLAAGVAAVWPAWGSIILI